MIIPSLMNFNTVFTITSSTDMPTVTKLCYVLKIKKQGQLRAEADRLGCLSSTDVWTRDNKPHGDSIQS